MYSLYNLHKLSNRDITSSDFGWQANILSLSYISKCFVSVVKLELLYYTICCSYFKYLGILVSISFQFFATTGSFGSKYKGETCCLLKNKSGEKLETWKEMMKSGMTDYGGLQCLWNEIEITAQQRKIR